MNTVPERELCGRVQTIEYGVDVGIDRSHLFNGRFCLLQQKTQRLARLAAILA